MAAEVTRDAVAPAPPSRRDALLSGLLVSLITAGALIRLRFSSLEGPLAELAGALAGAVFIPVALAQLAALRVVPSSRRASPVLHAVLVPWAAALATAAAFIVGSSWALARVRAAGLPATACASFEQLLAARWAPTGEGEPSLLATLPDGSGVLFSLEAGRPSCNTVAPLSRR